MSSDKITPDRLKAGTGQKKMKPRYVITCGSIELSALDDWGIRSNQQLGKVAERLESTFDNLGYNLPDFDKLPVGESQDSYFRRTTYFGAI